MFPDRGRNYVSALETLANKKGEKKRNKKQQYPIINYDNTPNNATTNQPTTSDNNSNTLQEYPTQHEQHSIYNDYYTHTT